MKKSLYHIKTFGILSFFCLSLLLPSFSLAATSKLSCTLTATTPNGEVELDSNDVVMLTKGEDIEIAWESKNAKKAYVGTGTKNPIELEGSATSSPSKTRTDTYRFENGNKKVYCKVKIEVVEGNFEDASMVTKITKPTLQGEAMGTKNVQVLIFKEDGKKPYFSSKQIRVKDGEWSTKISKNLSKGEYMVVLKGEKNTLLNTIATTTLTIGTKSMPKKTTSDTTFVVASVPLLSGGTIQAGATKPISYLQVLNIGKTVGKIEGFKIKQNGTAPTSAITSMTVSNEQGVLATINAPVFKDGVVTLPTAIPLLPQQMQLITIKVTLAPTAITSLGKQFKLDVSGVTTNGKMQSVFPIRGVIWTVGY